MMNVEYCGIEGLKIFSPNVYEDDRGTFMELYKLTDYGITFVQDNLSYSNLGTIRGLHYQVGEHAQGKLVTVLSGSVYDVAVDIREGSPTFGKYHGIFLSKKNKKQFYVPPGFAHGFMTLEEDTCFLYKCTSQYDKNSERSIMWNDSTLNIKWPSHIKDENVLISDKDAIAPKFLEAEVFPR
jgi:dTDP-4-dehydrorhamnose 3,5-epimerase